jgi:hypothetical protein
LMKTIVSEKTLLAEKTSVVEDVHTTLLCWQYLENVKRH